MGKIFNLVVAPLLALGAWLFVFRHDASHAVFDSEEVDIAAIRRGDDKPRGYVTLTDVVVGSPRLPPTTVGRSSIEADIWGYAPLFAEGEDTDGSTNVVVAYGSAAQLGGELEGYLAGLNYDVHIRLRKPEGKRLPLSGKVQVLSLREPRSPLFVMVGALACWAVVLVVGFIGLRYQAKP